jgi:hypothetical protein
MTQRAIPLLLPVLAAASLAAWIAWRLLAGG